MLPKYITAALAALFPLATAQTWTKCNPLTVTCPVDKGLNQDTLVIDFTKDQVSDTLWKTTGGTVHTGPNGAEFTVAKQGDAPTIDSNFHIFFGKVEVEMQVAPGTGIVSAFVMESSVLDEIDYEALGGDTTQIQANYFGKGDTSSYDRGSFQSVASPQTQFHTYGMEYTKDAMIWSIDGTPVRTVNYAQAKGGTRFPQTPMRVKLGVWAGGDPSNPIGTIEWAGGRTDFGKAPFTMFVRKVTVKNYNPAAEYTYSDHSGSYGSIRLGGGEGKVVASSSSVVKPTVSASGSMSVSVPASTGTGSGSGSGSGGSSSGGHGQDSAEATAAPSLVHKHNAAAGMGVGWAGVCLSVMGVMAALQL